MKRKLNSGSLDSNGMVVPVGHITICIGEAELVWFSLFVAAVLLLVIAIWFLNRYYAKASLETALVRTGLGGRKIVLDGGCLALPIVHRLQKVSLEAITVPVDRTGRDMLMCRDQLRADVVMEFEVKVDPSEEGVAKAAQSLGSRIARPGDSVQEVLHGFLVDSIHSSAARRSLEEIHSDRNGFTDEIAATVDARVAKLGLQLVSASMISVDQASLSQFDENNAFHAQGMRRLAEMVSEQRKARISIETATDIAVRESQLAQHQRQLEIQRAQQEAEIAQRAYFVKLEADTDSRSSQARAEAEMIAEMARINKDRDTRTAQLASDETLRKAEMKSVLVIDEARIENGIKLARKRAEEAVEKAREEASRAQVILAAEDVQAQKERVIAEREHEIAQMRQKKELLLEDAQIKNEINTLLARAKAKASAATMETDSQRERMEAEAAGKAALFAAENSMSESLVRLRLEERKLDRMPEIMTQMMKPVEKIESIRINQIAGLGSKSDGGEGGVDSAFGSAMDQILGMAVRLPAMRQMGEEIGLDFDANLAGRTADYANRIKSKKDDKG